MSGFSLPKGYNPVITPRFNKQQTDIFHDLLGKLGGANLNNTLDQVQGMAMGRPESFQGMENQAQSFFKNKLMPQIQQNYANSGLLNSSAFQGSQAQAAADLTENLQNKRMDYQQQSLRDLLGLLHQFSSTPTQEYGIQSEPKEEGFNIGSLLQLLGSLGKGALGV